LGRVRDFGLGPVAEIVKQSGAVGFGPDADFAGVFESVVFPGERFFAVKGDDEEMVFEINAERVPLAGGDFGVDAFLFRALALNCVIDGDVVLERIGAGYVVVIFILAAPYDAACLVLFAGDWLELHFDEAVFEAGVVFDADGIGGFTGLFEDIGFAGCGIICDDHPFGGAGAGMGGGPARWRSAGFEVIEVDGAGQCETSQKRARSCEC
jgi:hypothetical protein